MYRVFGEKTWEKVKFCCILSLFISLDWIILSLLSFTLHSIWLFIFKRIKFNHLCFL